MALQLNQDEILTLIYSDRTDDLIRRCSDLVNTGTTDSVAMMLLALRDDDDYFDEMSILLHAIERSPVASVYAATRDCFRDLSKNAPKWCDSVVRRHLNANENLTEFNVGKFVDTMRENDEAFVLVAEIANRLHADNAIPDGSLACFMTDLPGNSAG